MEKSYQLALLKEINMRNELKLKNNYLYLKSSILNSNFKRHHEDRIINSIYLDNENFDLFHESEEGNVPRFKLRYRWYGDCFFLKNGTLEKKITYENYRDKISFPIESCSFLKLSELFQNYFGYFFSPVIQVQYKREYYIDSQYNRITLDSDIKYYKMDALGLVYQGIPENDTILEFKIDLKIDENKILPSIHNNRTRYSKYCEGVRNCYL